jgi:hypothetical protein
MSDALTRGYAPSAHRVICIDYDSTLYPWAELMDEPEPIDGAVEAMRRLKAAGYRIVIFTSRLSPSWLAVEGRSAVEQVAHITRMLARDGIPYDDITAEKIPAEAYVDDRALRFTPGDWQAITDWLLFSRKP